MTTNKKSPKFMKSLSTALTTMRRTPYQSLSAILMVSLTFFVAYSFSFFAFTTHKIIQFFETRPQVIAFFDLDAESVTADQAVKNMENKEYVTQVTLINKEEALKLYKKENKDDPLLLDLVSADILPASIEVAGADLESLEKIEKDLANLEGIEEVVLQQDILDSLKTWTQNLRWIGLAAIGTLSISSLLIILVITGMKVTAKRQAISIMHILGASNWFVSAPFIMEGIVYGIFGSLLGWTISLTGILYLTPWLKDFISPVPLFPIPMGLFAIQLGIGSIIGIFLGAFASSASVRRMMRR
ncbi:MAG: permease-like cell division protein FtsX [Patescibacteria group bacterium]